MPFRSEPWPPGTPCWIDLAVPDPAAAAQLYGSIFGWSVVDSGPDFGNYQMASVADHGAAGIGPAQPGSPNVWTVYVATADVAATSASVTEHGGTVVVDPIDVPGMGIFSVVADPTGAVFGLWQANGHIGCSVVNQSGAFVWSDTYVGDVQRARAFYTAVFGWSYEDVADLGSTYATYRVAAEGDSVGGLSGTGNLPVGTPAHWMPYLGVNDADDAAAAFTAAGGTVLAGPFDSPFGRMATISDPWGARISIISTPAEDPAATV